MEDEYVVTDEQLGRYEDLIESQKSLIDDMYEERKDHKKINRFWFSFGFALGGMMVLIFTGVSSL